MVVEKNCGSANNCEFLFFLKHKNVVSSTKSSTSCTLICKVYGYTDCLLTYQLVITKCHLTFADVEANNINSFSVYVTDDNYHIFSFIPKD